MQKIKNFKTFINEDYGFGDLLQGAKNVFSKVTSWVSSLINKIKNGLVPINTKGKKKGLPMVGYFAYGDGNMLNQLESFYGGSGYSNLGNSKAKIKESQKLDEGDISAFLSWPGEEGPIDIGAEKLAAKIKMRYKTLTLTTTINPGEENERVITGQNKPIFIFGAPGIGKTEIVTQAAEELGLDLLVVDLEFMDPSDFLGVPKPVDIKSDKPEGAGVTRGNPPVWLPRTNNGKKYKDKGGIIFFDEVNRANQPVVTGCMKLFQSRRVMEYVLPTKWLIVAAGNRVSDDIEEAVKEMPTAFWDRVDAVNYVPTIEGFVSHVTGVDAKGKKTSSYDYLPDGGGGAPLREIVLPELLAFLQFSKEYFHTLDPSTLAAGRKFATPRGWIDASKTLYSNLLVIQAETGKKQISPEEVKDIFSASVGPTAAGAFLEFYQIVKNFPPADLEKVFTEPEKAPIPKSGDSPNHIWAKLAAVVSKSGDLGKLTTQQYGFAIDWSIRLKETLGDLASEYATAFVNMLNSKHDYVKGGPQAKDYLRNLTKFAEAYLVDFEEFRKSI